MTSTVYVNTDRTVMVREWENGVVEVMTREAPEAIWSPPVTVEKEAQGYQAPRCECGHGIVNHVNPQGHMLTVIHGRCLKCECPEFTEAKAAA